MGRSSAGGVMREEPRRAMIDAASRILADEGPAGLSVRRVANEVGASTMGVYTHFHDKDGLVDAVLAEGFARFSAALAAVREADPWAHLRALGRAYRGFARANPSFYKLLFGRAAPERPLPADSSRAFDSLIQAITRVMAELDRPARMIEPLAFDVWAAVHGMVSLELAGAAGDADGDAAYEHLLDFIVAGLRGS